MKTLKVQSISFFLENLWSEIKRFDLNGNLEVQTVTITEDNYDNLFDSQFADTTIYGQVFRYEK